METMLELALTNCCTDEVQKRRRRSIDDAVSRDFFVMVGLVLDDLIY